MKTPRQVIVDCLRGQFDDFGKNEACAEIIADLAAAGYAIVPVEPTQEMLDAAFWCKERHNEEWPGGEAAGPTPLDPSGEQYWRAMLAAASK